MAPTDDPSYDDLIEMKPSKILKTTYIAPKLPPPPSFPLPPNSKTYLHHQPSSRILSFENASPNGMDHGYAPTYLNSIMNPKAEDGEPPNRMNEPINRKGTKRAQPLYRNQTNAQDHIMAERKRREKLTQRFVALSALVPGLKKVHTTSKSPFLDYLKEYFCFFEIMCIDGQGFCVGRCTKAYKVSPRKSGRVRGAKERKKIRISGSCEQV